jgi:hypothetical protein
VTPLLTYSVDIAIAIDLKPPLKIFDDHCIDNFQNPMLQNLKEKTLFYRLCMVHIPGIKHRAAICILCHLHNMPVKLPTQTMLLTPTNP